MRNILIFLFLVMLAPIITSCEKEVICTDHYEMVFITVEDQSGNPVELDEYYTLRLKTGEKIEIIGGSSPADGIYEVIGDNFQKPLQGKKETFAFIGKKGSLTVKEEFKITADKCHISKVSGKEKVILTINNN